MSYAMTRPISARASPGAAGRAVPRLGASHGRRALRVVASAAADAMPRCPFGFGISPPNGKAKPKPSPLDVADSPNTVAASYWLEMGKPGQDVPGKLVSGLHRLYEVRHETLTLSGRRRVCGTAAYLRCMGYQRARQGARAGPGGPLRPGARARAAGREAQ